MIHLKVILVLYSSSPSSSSHDASSTLPPVNDEERNTRKEWIHQTNCLELKKSSFVLDAPLHPPGDKEVVAAHHNLHQDDNALFQLFYLSNLIFKIHFHHAKSYSASFHIYSVWEVRKRVKMTVQMTTIMWDVLHIPSSGSFSDDDDDEDGSVSDFRGLFPFEQISFSLDLLFTLFHTFTESRSISRQPTVKRARKREERWWNENSWWE